MSAIWHNLQGVLGNVGASFTKVLDKIFPPEQRAEALAKLQGFAMNNPKLAAFLTTQIAITGIPLLLFFTFTVTIFLFSLIAALLIGLVAALLFTVFMVGVALVVILPTVFLTTFAASFIFLWGLAGYYILKWVNEGEMPAPSGLGIGDKLNSLTGGRMSSIMDGARKKQEDVASGVDKTPKMPGGEESSGEKKGSGKAETEKDRKEKDNGASKKSGEESDNATPKANGNSVGPRKLETAKDSASKHATGGQK